MDDPESPSDTPTPPIEFPCPAVAGKTFVVACRLRESSATQETAQLLTKLGGRVATQVTPTLDYLIVLDPDPERPTPEERHVEALGDGHAVKVLDRTALRELISPSRDEAVVLLLGGDEGREQWRLRRSYPWGAIDLSGVDLRGAKLPYIVLYGVTLNGANLSGADLSASNVGDLVRVNLDGANLAHAAVSNLTDCSARGADLSSVRLNPAAIVRTDFTGARLHRVEGSSTQSEGATFRNADLTQAILRDSTFANAAFDGADMSQARLDRCNFIGSTFQRAVFAKASITRATFTNADLSGADFSGANLAGADFAGATIEGANFTGANLYAAKLDALGPGVGIGLVVPPPVALDRIGPGMRHLEDVLRRTGRLETSLRIDPDGRQTDVVQLVIRERGHGKVSGDYWVADQSEWDRNRSCQAETLCELMLELAQRWPGAELYAETLEVRASGKDAQRGLREKAFVAWHEAFGLPVPSQAQRRANQVKHRERFLVLLSGPSGVEQWNALGVNLTRAVHFRRSDLSGCDLRGADLSPHRGAVDCLDFTEANFDKANLTGADLRKCLLPRASLREAVLDDAKCPDADFRQADFTGASLRGCSLRSTKCCETNFSGADLTLVDFGEADLRGADLSTATLSGARFKAATYDETTTFPEGFTVPVAPTGRPPGLAVGCRVLVTAGAFTGSEGDVQADDERANKVTISITFWGRPVPVELDYDEIELL